MRYAHGIARTVFTVLNVPNRKRLNVDDLSDYMRRDLGLIDGRSVVCGSFAANDGRSRRLDLMTLTPYAS